MHSDDSLLDSCSKFTEYADLVKRDGGTAIASTEHGRPVCWISKKLYCDKIGLKFLHGCEVYLTESLDPDNKIRDNYHTILIARNEAGVKELNKLISISCEKSHFYYKNRISFDEFLNMSENIISTSACLASPLNRLPDDHPMYLKLAQKYDYLEVQPHSHPEQVAYNKRLLELSKKIGKPLIAGTDTHSSSAYKAECRDVLLSAKGQSYGDEDAFDLTYKTEDELVEMFLRQGALPPDVIRDAIENTNRMADSVEEFELDTSIKYPILHGSREEDSKKFTETVWRMFYDKVRSGIIPQEQVDAFKSAIEEEMRVFRKLNMDGFMLSMSELLSWCKGQGMAIGTARGSVGGSRVAYVTDIIDMNPETWNTVFSRFCNEDRVEIGDIDIDCVESDRPAIFSHIYDRFGREHCARVASFGTIKSLGVIDEVGRHLAKKWLKTHDDNSEENPYSIANVKRIKADFAADEEKAKEKYPDVFYYYDGMLGVKISQSVHPAGIVISPIPLDENYGTFDKDDDNCLMIDMDEAHEVGIAKYDFLALKTVTVIRDTCEYIGEKYPKTHEINWSDKDVWEDMLISPFALFQFEKKHSHDCLRRFGTKNIFDMSLVTACIRPSGASYRDELFARKIHKNPSPIIDKLLEGNLGYLVYQEDTIKFLKDICGLSGSEADSVRRAIGHKRRDKLEEALPSILDGYCAKSDKTRDVAVEEAKEFLQVIEDSASYQFGYNHSIAYCLLGYLCAYYRYYHPVEFITAFLNNAANDEDILNGSMFARQKGIRISDPKFGISKSHYFFNPERTAIAKGLSSMKHIGDSVAEDLYELAKNLGEGATFVDVLYGMKTVKIDSRQVDILIKTDFFSDFGNQRELFSILSMFRNFNDGDAKKIKRESVDGTELEPIIRRHATWTKKDGTEAKSYTLTDVRAILDEYQEFVYSRNLDDLSVFIKVRNYKDIMGYPGYVSGKEVDRNKLYVKKIFPVKRRKDGQIFAYNILTQSIGSGKESSMTVFKRKFDEEPFKEDDLIACRRWERDGKYFRILDYEKIYV